MDNHLYRLIYPNSICRLDVSPTDEIAAPAEFSVIAPETWEIMIDQAGSEETLLAELGVTYEIPNQEI